MKIRKPLLALLFLCGQLNAAVALSNLDDLADRNETIFSDISPGEWHATPFSTDGSNYQLNSITANIGDFTTSGTLFMEIWSAGASTAAPESSLHRLTLSIDTNGVKSWDSNFTLSANTSYFAVMGADNGGGQWKQFLNTNDPYGSGTPFGDFRVDQGTWTLDTDFMGSPLAQSYSSSSFGASWLSDGAIGAPLRFEIDATVIPEPNTVLLLGIGTLAFLRKRR
ncbi:choice-of-anchor R domain-containing protein [Rubritalea sp.]|uniref:choice-of-anchor R domain-containing protein n=1 Tax=Rubritalea sp. TaxID=2109375 RepID=UPI003EF965BC